MDLLPNNCQMPIRVSLQEPQPNEREAVAEDKPRTGSPFLRPGVGFTRNFGTAFEVQRGNGMKQNRDAFGGVVEFFEIMLGCE